MPKAKNSRAYQKAKNLVGATLASPKKLMDLIQSAQDKASGSARDRLSEVFEPLKRSFRLIKAYANGSYRDISIENIGMIVAAIIYFVMPIDALPDFLLVFGLTDDAAILAWTFKTLKDELDKFAVWENQDDDTDPSISSDI